MRYRFSKVSCVVLLCALAASGCITVTSSGQEAAPGPPPNSNEELEALYHARIDSARMRFTEADARFITAMIPHHTQALILAGLTATHTTNPTLQTLSGRISSAQQDEIALMEQWLRDRRQPVPQLHVEGLRIMMHGGAQHDMQMPGMLTDEELRALDRARGAEFDRLFLTYMIRHHQGAITMVQQLFATDGAAQEQQVFKLATDVQVDQITEINRMEQLLAALHN